jgi:hypothetical protein
MGTPLELNDTLLLSTEQGFPAALLDRERHVRAPLRAEDFAHQLFEFHGKEGARFFHLAPTRVVLVHKIGERWLAWGHALIEEQTIRRPADGRGYETAGKFRIAKLFDPHYQELHTRNETPPGRSYFG